MNGADVALTGSLEATVRSVPRSLTIVTTLALVVALAACGSDGGATITVKGPANDSKVAGGVKVDLIAEGITIEEAGKVRDGAGHFHILADTGCAKPGDAIAKDADHVHLGKGQADGTVYLEPGRHELCMQVGDGEHHALNVRDTIKVDVGIDDLDQWCGVMSEVDDLFQATDSSDDELAVKQVSYENIHRLLAQVHERLDLVDADQRAAVTAAIEAASTITEVLVTTDDPADIDAQLAPIFDQDPFAPADTWVQDTCNVSITD